MLSTEHHGYYTHTMIYNTYVGRHTYIHMHKLVDVTVFPNTILRLV